MRDELAHASEDDAARARDDEARERIRSSLDESLLVEAAAGTGKTTELVSRLVAVLAAGKTTVDRLVAVTFTRKAAGELQLRLRHRLDGARAASDDRVERRRLGDAIARLEEAHIGTIHSFCAEILRARPVEAGIDPAFRELDDDDARRVYEQAFRAWIERRLDHMPEGLRRALSREAGRRSFDGTSPLDRLRAAGWSLVDWRDFPAEWEQRDFDREAAIDDLLVDLADLAEQAARSRNRGDYLRRALEPVCTLAAAVARAEGLSEEAGETDRRNDSGRRDYDRLEAELLDLLRQCKRTKGWKGRGKEYAPGLPRADVQARRDALLAALDAFRQAADADLAVELRRELSDVLESYEQLKRRSGYLDFLDLLLLARDLVRDQPEVRHHLQQRFSHIFVDEFQDTDPLQAEILLLLAADDPDETDWRAARPVPGKLFLVGDPKQSIYRFRRADVLLYRQIQSHLTGAPPEGAGVGLVHLSRSFRAVRSLQQGVNAVFAAQMTGDDESGQPTYVPLDRQRPDRPDQPAWIALPAHAPYGPWGKVTGRAIEECLPEAVAGFVEWLLHDSGWTVGSQEGGSDDGEAREPIRPRHICLLFRRFLSWGSDVTRPYTQAFEARGIPHLLIGGRSFHQREEVEALRAALTAVEWPDDELAVFATLKGSLFAIPDELLLRFREDVGSLHPFRPLAAVAGSELDLDYEPIADALDHLAQLHRRRNRVPVAETVHRLLTHTRAHAGFALRPAGNQVLANVQRVSDLARRFELSANLVGALSFRGFVERLDEEAEQVGGGGSPVLEEGAEGVRLMTVHAAKGLEFPIVVLADPTAKLAREEPGLYVDPESHLAAYKLLGCAPWELTDHADLERKRDQAEGVRLAYVAATRARDLVVAPVLGDGAHGTVLEDAWLSPLHRGLYPTQENWRRAAQAPGCPRRGDRTILDRPQDHDGRPEASVLPGLHYPQEGEHPVVWWDPKTLRLRVRGNYGLQQEDLLAEDDDGTATPEGVARYTAWRARRYDALEAGGVPEFRITLPTDTEEPPPGFAPPIRLEVLPRPKSRPSGMRFGTLVHTVLRDVSFDAEASEISKLTELHGRALEATGKEIKAGVKVVQAALAHELLQDAARSSRCYRETPFLLPLEDGPRQGEILEGTFDLAFERPDATGQWVVVDFKTDPDLKAVEDKYRRQLAWYVVALERMTGGKAEGVLLGV